MGRWKEFEKLAEQILAELQPMAEVKWNDFICGHLSGIKRQIDVSIRWSSGEDNYLTIVQAKDYDERVGVEIVDTFLSVIRDVRATGGILICRSGFARTVYNYARKCGVLLLNLHDAQSTNWSLQLTVPILWVELTPMINGHLAAYLKPDDRRVITDSLGAVVLYRRGPNSYRSNFDL